MDYAKNGFGIPQKQRPIMAKINGYYTSADVMKKKITNLYASKIGGDRPLDKAKVDIEAEHDGHSFGSQRSSESRTILQLPTKSTPSDRKQQLHPYSAPLVA